MKKAAAKTTIKKRRGRPASAPPTPIAAAIRAARERRGLTLEQAAAKLGVNYQTWQKWENGKNEPTIQSLARVASALGVTVARLMG